MLLIVFFCSGELHCQDTLAVDWHTNICSNGYIDKVYEVETDSLGNVYTIGTFPNVTNALGQAFHDSTGNFLLTKQDSLGNLIFNTNFGGENYFSHASIELNDAGEIIIAANFIGTFWYSDDSITHSSNYSAILMKLDSSFNLIWHSCAIGIKSQLSQVFTNGLTQDENQNIYVNIQYIDSLSINGVVYDGNDHLAYRFLICKYDSNGNFIWSRKYNAEPGKGIGNSALEYRRIGDNLGSVFISGGNSGDTLFIDDLPYLVKNGNGSFLTKLAVNGNILESVFYQNVSIHDIAFLNDRIFCDGTYKDTVFWSGIQTIGTNFNTLFIAELNPISDMINFIDLQSSDNIFPGSFLISEKYGFVISGGFNGAMSVQSSSVNLNDWFNRGGFIISFDQNYDLANSKYIMGGYYGLRDISIFDNNIFGVGVFENNCHFENLPIWTQNDDISVFRTKDLATLNSFNPTVGTTELLIENCDNVIYPNPTNEYLRINSESIVIKNIVGIDGRVIYDYKIQIDDFKKKIDISNLSEGAYILNIIDCNGVSNSIRFNKVN